jgi:Ulp1 family protease
MDGFMTRKQLPKNWPWQLDKIDIALVPYYINKKHWDMVAVKLCEKFVLTFDSLHDGQPNESKFSFMKNAL